MWRNSANQIISKKTKVDEVKQIDSKSILGGVTKHWDGFPVTADINQNPKLHFSDHAFLLGTLSIAGNIIKVMLANIENPSLPSGYKPMSLTSKQMREHHIVRARQIMKFLKKITKDKLPDLYLFQEEWLGDNSELAQWVKENKLGFIRYSGLLVVYSKNLPLIPDSIELAGSAAYGSTTDSFIRCTFKLKGENNREVYFTVINTRLEFSEDLIAKEDLILKTINETPKKVKQIRAEQSNYTLYAGDLNAETGQKYTGVVPANFRMNNGMGVAATDAMYLRLPNRKIIQCKLVSLNPYEMLNLSLPENKAEYSEFQQQELYLPRQFMHIADDDRYSLLTKDDFQTYSEKMAERLEKLTGFPKNNFVFRKAKNMLAEEKYQLQLRFKNSEDFYYFLKNEIEKSYKVEEKIAGSSPKTVSTGEETTSAPADLSRIQFLKYVVNEASEFFCVHIPEVHLYRFELGLKELEENKICHYLKSWRALTELNIDLMQEVHDAERRFTLRVFDSLGKDFLKQLPKDNSGVILKSDDNSITFLAKNADKIDAYIKQIYKIVYEDKTVIALEQSLREQTGDKNLTVKVREEKESKSSSVAPKKSTGVKESDVSKVPPCELIIEVRQDIYNFLMSKNPKSVHFEMAEGNKPTIRLSSTDLKNVFALLDKEKELFQKTEKEKEKPTIRSCTDNLRKVSYTGDDKLTLSQEFGVDGGRILANVSIGVFVYLQSTLWKIQGFSLKTTAITAETERVEFYVPRNDFKTVYDALSGSANCRSVEQMRFILSYLTKADEAQVKFLITEDKGRPKIEYEISAPADICAALSSKGASEMKSEGGSHGAKISMDPDKYNTRDKSNRMVTILHAEYIAGTSEGEPVSDLSNFISKLRDTYKTYSSLAEGRANILGLRRILNVKEVEAKTAKPIICELRVTSSTAERLSGFIAQNDIAHENFSGGVSHLLIPASLLSNLLKTFADFKPATSVRKEKKEEVITNIYEGCNLGQFNQLLYQLTGYTEADISLCRQADSSESGFEGFELRVNASLGLYLLNVMPALPMIGQTNEQTSNAIFIITQEKLPELVGALKTMYVRSVGCFTHFKDYERDLNAEFKAVLTSPKPSLSVTTSSSTVSAPDKKESVPKITLTLMPNPSAQGGAVYCVTINENMIDRLKQTLLSSHIDIAFHGKYIIIPCAKIMLFDYVFYKEFLAPPAEVNGLIPSFFREAKMDLARIVPGTLMNLKDAVQQINVNDAKSERHYQNELEPMIIQYRSGVDIPLLKHLAKLVVLDHDMRHSGYTPEQLEKFVSYGELPQFLFNPLHINSVIQLFFDVASQVHESVTKKELAGEECRLILAELRKIGASIQTNIQKRYEPSVDQQVLIAVKEFGAAHCKNLKAKVGEQIERFNQFFDVLLSRVKNAEPREVSNPDDVLHNVAVGLSKIKIQDAPEFLTVHKDTAFSSLPLPVQKKSVASPLR